MNREEWNELPIGTVTLYEDDCDNWSVEVKKSNTEVIVVGGDFWSIYLDEDSVYDDDLEYTEIAPKWIQELF